MTPHRLTLLLGGLVLTLAACGRVAPAPLLGPPTAYQTLVVGAPDAEGNRLTTLYDSASGRAVPAPVPLNGTEPRFGGGGRIAYLLPTGVMSVDPASASQRTEAADATLVAGDHAWSRDGSLAYLASPATPSSGRPAELTIRQAGGTEVTVLLTGNLASAGLRFSPDGRRLLLSAPGSLVVLGLDGTVVLRLNVAPETLPSQVAWTADGTLYYPDARGVSAIDPATGATRTILASVRWEDPDVSPDGRHIVFARRDGQGLPRLELLDTATGQLVGGFSMLGASHARFVSPGQLWFHEELLCDGCGTLTAPAAEILRYDLADGVERTTGLNGFVADVRPARQ